MNKNTIQPASLPVGASPAPAALSPFALATAAPGGGALANILTSRENTETLASIWIAKQFPRDLALVTASMRNACSRLALALSATYSYQRAGTPVTGPSIRLAEALLAAWGNADAGWKEVSRSKDPKTGIGTSECLAFCVDKENNIRREIAFTVPHVRDKKTGNVTLTSERDIYELCANMAARRIRACVLQVLPGWLVEEALDLVKQTREKGDTRPLADILRNMEARFADLGVTRAQLEDYLGHTLPETTRKEVIKLGEVYTSITGGDMRIKDYFPDKPDAGKPVIVKASGHTPGTPTKPEASDIIPGLDIPEEQQTLTDYRD